MKNALVHMQEVCEALKKTLPHILDEIEALNISVVALHQEIQSIRNALKILGKEGDVIHKGNEEKKKLLSRRLFKILREFCATSPGFTLNNS